MGVYERCDSMGVRKIVDSRQFKVERAKIWRDEHRSTEFAEVRGRRDGDGLGGKGGACPSRIASGSPSRLRASSVNGVKGTGGIGPSRLASKLSVNRVNAKHGRW